MSLPSRPALALDGCMTHSYADRVVGGAMATRSATPRGQLYDRLDADRQQSVALVRGGFRRLGLLRGRSVDAGRPAAVGVGEAGPGIADGIPRPDGRGVHRVAQWQGSGMGLTARCRRVTRGRGSGVTPKPGRSWTAKAGRRSS